MKKNKAARANAASHFVFRIELYAAARVGLPSLFSFGGGVHHAASSDAFCDLCLLDVVIDEEDDDDNDDVANALVTECASYCGRIVNGVLERALPTLREKRPLGEKDAGVRLGRFFRGGRVWIDLSSSASDKNDRNGGVGPIVAASVRRCDARDAPTLASWYEEGGDKYLPNTDRSWSDWWETRCRSPDPSCEMLKLVGDDNIDGVGDLGEDDSDGPSSSVLGVVYYERNVADDVLPNRPRTTLLRGVRVNPDLNPEAERRRRGAGDRGDDGRRVHNVGDPREGIVAALAMAVLARSLLCGTSGAGVNATKSETEEGYWRRLFGEAVVLREDDGRRYYASRGEDRFRSLRREFERQLDLESDAERRTTRTTTTTTTTGPTAPPPASDARPPVSEPPRPAAASRRQRQHNGGVGVYAKQQQHGNSNSASNGNGQHYDKNDVPPHAQQQQPPYRRNDANRVRTYS